MKKHFFLKLLPPRSTFVTDMTPEEKVIMQNHVGYWTALLNSGVAILFGVVLDPSSGYGVGVVSVDSDDHLKQIISNDPANGLNKYEYYPMRAMFKQN
jgi:hypothetical protein